MYSLKVNLKSVDFQVSSLLELPVAKVKKKHDVQKSQRFLEFIFPCRKKIFIVEEVLDLKQLINISCMAGRDGTLTTENVSRVSQQACPCDRTGTS